MDNTDYPFVQIQQQQCFYNKNKGYTLVKGYKYIQSRDPNAMIKALENIQALFSKFMNRISNLADDGKLEQIKKIEKLLKEIVD